MPKLSRKDPHHCPLCDYKSVRSKLKDHLTSTGKKGLRCPGLKSVIPAELWKGIVSHYTNDAPLPDLSGYTKKKPKLSPLKDLTPGSRHITRRLKNALNMIEKEATEQNITMTSLLGLLIHKVNYVHNRDIAGIGWSLFKGESITKKAVVSIAKAS